MDHILLVEDDIRLAELITQFLEQNNFKVSVLNQGDLVIDFVNSHQPNLILLDIMLPRLDGFSIIRAIRPTFTNPILFLTAKDSDFDHVKGLEIGADDYIIKPIEPHVLLARINNALRRARPVVVPNQSKIVFGQLCVDKENRQVTLADKVVDLTSHEYELILLLVSHPGEVQTREKIYQEIIGREYDGFDRSVDVRISRLRKKLGDDVETPNRIITVWGKGYVLSRAAWE